MRNKLIVLAGLTSLIVMSCIVGLTILKNDYSVANDYTITEESFNWNVDYANDKCTRLSYDDKKYLFNASNSGNGDLSFEVVIYPSIKGSYSFIEVEANDEFLIFSNSKQGCEAVRQELKQ